MTAPYHLILEKPDSFKDYFLFDEDKSISHIPNFNTINIIVGANNSGKSRFIRYLMSFINLKRIDLNFFKQYNDYVREYNKQFIRQDHLHLRLLVPDELDIISTNKTLYENNRVGAFSKIKAGLTGCETKLFRNINDIKRYYIPTLRTAHSLYTNTVESQFKRLDNDIYEETLNHYYAFEKNLNVFTGMTLYEEVLNSRNSEKIIRDRFELFERFLSENFFENKQIDIVAKFNKGENKLGKSDSELLLIHVQGESHTRKLYELGDGIQALIILMYKVFMAEPKSIFFIDEPELNLHPGMQRLFLEQIYKNKTLTDKELIYIICTHSNHFLDLTLEKNNVSIYSFSPRIVEKGKQFIIKNVNGGNNELLKHLGVNNSSVFLANCSIWVEGISDRNYIKAFLKAYLKYLSETKSKDYRFIKEDIDYAFFEYSGSNIEHYIFEDIDDIQQDEILREINALALSNRIFLLADSDNVDGRTKKGIRLKKLEDNKKDNFIPKIIRQVREIENLLTNDVWNRILINFCNKNLVDKEKDLILERITAALKNNSAIDHKKDYIGIFLNKIDSEVGGIHGTNILNKICEEKDGKYGTFIQKRELSEYVLQADFSWDVFKENPEIVELTESIYKFILDSKN